MRKWFNHDPKKWSEFKKRFYAELLGEQEMVTGLVSAARKGTVTLLFGSKEEHFNNAVALKEYIESRMKASERKKGRLKRERRDASASRHDQHHPTH